MGGQRSFGWIVFGWIVGLLFVTLSGASFAQGVFSVQNAPRPSLGWMIATVSILLLLILVFVAYMFYLQRHFLIACQQDKQLDIFFQSPAGLPPGSIRSIMTLIIVTSALYLIVVTMFMGPPTVFPEVMAAVLSSVVGFYFGSRAGSRQDSTASQELVQARQQKDAALADKDETVATGLLKKVDKGITLAKTVACPSRRPRCLLKWSMRTPASSWHSRVRSSRRP